MVIPDDYANLMQEGRMVDITIRADLSEDALNSPLRRIDEAVKDYAREIASNRILLSVPLMPSNIGVNSSWTKKALASELLTI